MSRHGKNSALTTPQAQNQNYLWWSELRTRAPTQLPLRFRTASAKGNWYRRKPASNQTDAHSRVGTSARPASNQTLAHSRVADTPTDTAPVSHRIPERCQAPSIPQPNQPNTAPLLQKVTGTAENPGPTIKNPTHTAGPIVSRKTVRYYPPHLRRSSALSPPEVSP